MRLPITAFPVDPLGSGLSSWHPPIDLRLQEVGSAKIFTVWTSPNPTNAKTVEQALIAHQVESLHLGLGDEHAGEWISVLAGHQPRLARVLDRYWEGGEVLAADDMVSLPLQ